uniref:Capsid protein n=1 Tax=viral metagenome TaxID=1070528 RepID=A0A6M3MGB7_9ZZZZ
MQSRIFNLNWETFDYRDHEQRRQLIGAMQYFCALPNRFMDSRFAKIEEFIKTHKKIQEFTIASDGWVNEKAIDIIEKFHLMTHYDNGYEQIFDVRDFSGTKASGFDMAAVRSGLTFREVKVGEKLKVYQMEGAKERVHFCYYGGALGWHRGLFEDGDWWTIEDNAIEFRNKAYSSRAATYYALLEAAADAKGCCALIPSSCEKCDDDARSIASSINYAATNILTIAGARGLSADVANTTFIVLTPLQLRGRVRYALGQRMQAFADSEKLIDYNFKQVTSMMLTHTDRIMVILPARTLKIGYKTDLTLFDNFDMLSYTDTVAGWMRHGGCIGDIDQINCIELTEESGSCPPGSFQPLVSCGEVSEESEEVEDIRG